MKKTVDEENKEQEMNDYLYPNLLSRNLVGEKVIAYAKAIEIKTEVMNKLKERML